MHVFDWQTGRFRPEAATRVPELILTFLFKGALGAVVENMMAASARTLKQLVDTLCSTSSGADSYSILLIFNACSDSILI